ncbi:MAG: TonB-dependent receptor [Bauldia sp.]
MAFALALALLASPALAAGERPILLDEVEVVGYALDLTKGDNPGATVALVTRLQIEERQYKDLEGALRDIPALAVSSGGTRGGFTQLRLRGAEANHTLVTVDGESVNMVADGDVDISGILIDDVEKIEVIKGPQSGLYGAGAHSGVIAITTISGRGLAKPLVRARVEAGVPRLAQGSATIAGSNGRLYGAFTAGGFTDHGHNASAFGTERDGDTNWQANLRLGADLSDTVNVEGFVRASRNLVQSDPTDFNCLLFDINFVCVQPSPTYGRAIDGDNLTDWKRLAYGATGTVLFLGGDLVNRAAVSRFEEEQTFRESGVQSYRSNGERTRVEDRATYKWSLGALAGTVSGQVDYLREVFAYESPFALPFAADGIERWQTGIAGEVRASYTPSGTTLALNARSDRYSAFPTTPTWRVAASQKFGDSDLHASVGTGTTVPTFYEQFGIFGSFVGNPGLRLEHSLGWDAGVETRLAGGALTLGATVFSTRLEDEIAATPFNIPCGMSFCYTLINLDGISTRKGIELTAAWRIDSAFTLSGAYSYVVSRDPTGADEVRRPRHTGSIDLAYKPAGSPWSGGVAVTFTGDFRDIRSLPNFPFVETIDMPGYALVSARAAYQVNANLSLTARIENLFDSKHEDIFGFPGPGRVVAVGAKAAF